MDANRYDRERAEAQLRRERAELHDRGMADHELVEEHERDEFAGTSGTQNLSRSWAGTMASESAQARIAKGAGPRTILPVSRTSKRDKGRSSIRTEEAYWAVSAGAGRSSRPGGTERVDGRRHCAAGQIFS